MLSKLYIVKATVQGMNRTISIPMSKTRTEKLAESLTNDMRTAIPKYQWAKDISIEQFRKNIKRKI